MPRRAGNRGAMVARLCCQARALTCHRETPSSRPDVVLAAGLRCWCSAVLRVLVERSARKHWQAVTCCGAPTCAGVRTIDALNWVE